MIRPHQPTRRLSRSVAFVSCAAITLVGLLMTGCTTNAATGESRLMLGYMSRSQQIALGADAMPQLTQQYGGVVPSAEITAYVRGIGERLAQETEADNPSLPWEFTLLDSPVINAFALPGGKVFMSRGLAEKMTNEAQLAGVLGHEIGHVTAEHVAERIQTSTGTSLLAQVLSAAAGMGDSAALQQLTDVVVGYGGQGYLLKFGRSQELEADKLGMRYMTQSGYDPAGQRQVMEILAAESKGSRPPEILSTHPLPASRIAKIDSLLSKEYAGITGTPAVGFYRDRFKSRFLGPIGLLPPATAAGGQVGAVRYAWCGLCSASD